MESGDESDNSISTEEMNQNIEEKKSSVERIKPKPKRKMSEKQLENLRKGREKREANKKAKEEKKAEEKEVKEYNKSYGVKPEKKEKNDGDKKNKKTKKDKKPEPEMNHDQEPEPVVNEIVEPEAPVKKPRGRPKKPESEKGKVIEKTIIEKHFYLAPIGENGQYEKVNVSRITPKNVKRFENIEKSKELMEEHDTTYKLKKNGQIDKRSSNRGANKQRTEKQIAAAKALGERTRQKYAKLKEEKEKKLKHTIEDTIIDVVSTPIQKVKEKKMEERKSLEQKQKEQMLKSKSLFS
jgi:hypothetical protein